MNSNLYIILETFTSTVTVFKRVKIGNHEFKGFFSHLVLLAIMY